MSQEERRVVVLAVLANAIFYGLLHACGYIYEALGNSPFRFVAVVSLMLCWLAIVLGILSNMAYYNDHLGRLLAWTLLSLVVGLSVFLFTGPLP